MVPESCPRLGFLWSSRDLELLIENYSVLVLMCVVVIWSW